MDAEYLKANVGDVLAAGLTAVVLDQPEDSVDYLGRWLLKYVENFDAAQTEKDESARLAVLDQQAEEEAKAKAAAEEKAKTEKEEGEKNQVKAFEDFLNGAANFEGLLEQYLQHLQNVTGATSCYIGQKEIDESAPPPPEEGEENEGDEVPVSNENLKYVATTEDNEFLIGKRLNGSEGVTFGVFKEEKKAEGGDDEDGGEEGEGDEGDDKPAKEEVPEEEKELVSVFVPNVLLGATADKMKFWRLPDLGAYFACRMNYESCLNGKTLEAAVEREGEIMEAKTKAEEDEKAKAEGGGEGEEGEGGEEEEDEEAKAAKEAAAKEEEERKAAEQAALEEKLAAETEEEREAREREEKAALDEANELYLVSHLPREPCDFAICMDTLGQNRQFNTEELELAKRFGKLLRQTMLRIDRALFKEERSKRKEMQEMNEAAPSKSVAEQEVEMATLAKELEKSGGAATAADVAFRYRQGVIVTIKQLIAEFKSYNVFRGELKVLQCMFFLLDYPKNQVVDCDGKPQWKTMRGLFNDDLFQKLQAYDPREAQMRGAAQKHATLKALKKLLKGLDYDTLKTNNFPLAEIFAYVRDALGVKSTAKQERKDAAAALKAEEEAKKLEEEEAKAAAAAEAGEGAEGGAEGEGDDDPEN